MEIIDIITQMIESNKGNMFGNWLAGTIFYLLFVLLTTLFWKVIGIKLVMKGQYWFVFIMGWIALSLWIWTGNLYFLGR